MSARNRELLALVPASLLLTAGFAAIFVQQSARAAPNVSLTYGAVFLGAVPGRAPRDPLRRCPYADPYLFPLVAVLACFGLVMIYRIDEDARARAGAVVRRRADRCSRRRSSSCATTACSSATATRSRRRPRCCCCCRACPGSASRSTAPTSASGSARSRSSRRSSRKIAIVIFLAALPARHAPAAGQGARRFLGVTIPPLKHFGPLLVVWGGAMVMLVFIRDLGSSLMFFGGFLALLYVATNRLSFVVVGLALFALGAWFFADTVGARAEPHRHLARPVRPASSTTSRRLATRSRSRCSRRPTAGCSATASARRCSTQPGRRRRSCPAPQTDLIYAVIVNELGLVGACGLLLVYLLFVERGFKIAMLARDSFSKLLAAGPDRGLRAAGVRDRRRRHEGDPADRRDAAVRLLRRLVDRRELHAAGAAAARLRPRAAAGGAR